MTECKYCGDKLPELICAGVIAPVEYQPTMCVECAERSEDWMHDADMEAR